MIRAVIFDVDGVLIDSFEANLKFFQDLLDQAGYRSPTREEYEKMFHLTMERVIREVVGDQDEEVKRVWLMGKNRKVRYPNELITTPNSMLEVIRELERRYRLAIVTSRVEGGCFRCNSWLN